MKQIYINGHVITIDKLNPKAEAFIVEDGRFGAVGSSEDMLIQKDQDSTVIDLQGATVIPGFNDSHLHLLNYAYGKAKVDLSQLKSTEEVILASKEYISRRQNHYLVRSH